MPARSVLVLSLLFTLAPAAASAQDVLLLWDVDNTDTQSLVSALGTAGLVVTSSDTDESGFDGTNPDPAGFDVVIHLDGTTYNTDMPVAGQDALVAFVAAGGGYIHTEWTVQGFGEVGMLQQLRDLLLFDWVVTGAGPVTWTAVSGQEAHPAIAGVSSPVSFVAGWTGGPLHTFATDPATLLMTDASGYAAVAVREWGAGRIVGFAHAGNYGASATLSEPDVQQLMVDAVLWTAPPPPCADGDSDGFPDAACGGDDCDDADPAVYPGAVELHDGADQDCDGLFDEGVLPPDALVVTEILQDPAAVGDAAGEWFEVHNNTAVPMNLAGLLVADLGSDDFTVVGDLPVPAAGWAVFGASDDASSNGGAPVDYAWSGYTLANGVDEVVLIHDGAPLDTVAYGGGGWPGGAGVAMSLDPGLVDPLLNDDPAAWCDAVDPFGDGDLGSPGAPNPPCPTGDDDDSGSAGDDDDSALPDDDDSGSTGDDDDSALPPDDDDVTDDDDAVDDDDVTDDDDAATDDDDTVDDDDAATDDDDSGVPTSDCTCSAPSHRPTPAWLLLLVPLVARRRG